MTEPKLAGQVLRYTRSGLELLAHLAVVIGIIVAGIAYLSETRQARLNAAMAYLERFNTGQTLEARNAIYVFWRKTGRETVMRIGPANAKILALKDIRVAPAAQHELPVVNLVDFFDGLNLCIETGVCEPRPLQAELHGYARNLLNLYGGFITEMRDQKTGGLSGFGKGLEAFVARGDGRAPPASPQG